jgi:hypothetical protein
MTGDADAGPSAAAAPKLGTGTAGAQVIAGFGPLVVTGAAGFIGFHQ